MADVLSNPEAACLLGLLFAVGLYLLAGLLSRRRLPAAAYLRLIWVFLLCFTVAELVSVTAALWGLALICFWALREYFSLVDIRLQDRLGILGGYLSIPFMILFIQQEWYGMFIVSIPVYAFLAVPLLITLGGRERTGTVFSMGVVNFGLFLFVYCLGHLGYLMLSSVWMAALLMLSAVLCDAAAHLLRRRPRGIGPNLLARYLLPLPFTIGLSLLLCTWTGIPHRHCVGLGALIPFLSIAARHTTTYIKADLGIRSEDCAPGTGLIIDNLQSLLFVAPVGFHYLWYFLL